MLQQYFDFMGDLMIKTQSLNMFFERLQTRAFVYLMLLYN